MKKNFKKILAAALSSLPVLQAVPAFAASGGSGKPGSSGSSGSSSVSYSAANTISSSTSLSGQSYSSTTGGQNALLVSGGSSILKNVTVTKTGSPSGSSDNYDFYGMNAAVLVYNGAKLDISGGTVSTDASYANAVFAYGTGEIEISDVTISTSSNNSGGVMVTGGGSLTANDLTVTTQGGSSASIRSDRGGGTLVVNGGSYTTSGKGSPVVYSTADITVNDAEMTANVSEGVVVEGANSVTLNDVELTASNTQHNGKSTTYKSIFLYQSQSGDAAEGTSYFTANDSTITNNNGDIFFVTNTSAVITLTDNTFVNNDADGGFLRAEAGAWGSSGSNGGDVTLKLIDQDVSGDIYIDSISTLDMSLSDGSSYTGTINGTNEAESVDIVLDSGSTLTLTGDSYISSLKNADSSNSNIVLNGYKLYVNGTAVSAASSSGTASSGSSSSGNASSGTVSFSDVSSTAYYYAPVVWALAQGITGGTSAGTFSPDSVCTRAQIVTFLWRAAGSPEPEGSCSFSDVDEDSYYYKAVVWAAENGITGGTGGGKFSPDAACTRAQAITFLWRAEGCPAEDESSSFSDVSAGSYYYDAVSWAVEEGITGGTGGGKFSPGASCTRAQIVTFLYREAN